MKCSRCAAELPGSATFCPSCGATTTSGLVISSTFSYLPAGAPPWPTTMPAKPVYVTDTAASASSVDTKQARKSGRSVGSIITTIALIIFAPLLGIGITLGILTTQGLFPPGAAAAHPKGNVVVHATPVAATPTPTAVAQSNQLPTPTSFKTTNSKDVNITLQYPGDWVAENPQKSNVSSSLIIHTPQQQTGIEFFVARYTDSTSASFSSADDVNRVLVTSLSQQQSNTGFQLVSSPTAQPSIGGTKWMQMDATYTDTTVNLKLHLVTIAVLHNKVYYNIAVLMPDQYYNEAMQKYIQHMLDTFQFLS